MPVCSRLPGGSHVPLSPRLGTRAPWGYHRIASVQLTDIALGYWLELLRSKREFTLPQLMNLPSVVAAPLWKGIAS
jgi:hypothetical protein